MANGEIGNGNLKKYADYTAEERREFHSQGGKASVAARRKIKSLREGLLALMNDNVVVDGQKMSGYEAMCAKLVEMANNGNPKAWEILRDTIGEKPTDNINVSGADDNAIEITFVDKTKPKAVESDPKIVGESSPRINSEEK